MSALKVFCPKCNSTDVRMHVINYNQYKIPCTCNNCGEKFELPLGNAKVIEVNNRFYYPQPLPWQTEAMTRGHNNMEQSWTQDMTKAMKALKFDWEKNGPLIPLLLMFAFAGLVLIASNSYNSWLSTPYTIAAILSGLIYLVLIIYRKMNTPKYKHVR